MRSILLACAFLFAGQIVATAAMARPAVSYYDRRCQVRGPLGTRSVDGHKTCHMKGDTEFCGDCVALGRVPTTTGGTTEHLAAPSH